MTTRKLDITEQEIRAVRWVEKILTPLIVAGMLALATFSFNVDRTLAELKAEHQKFDGSDGYASKDLAAVKAQLNELTKAQHAIELNVESMMAHQGHFRAAIADMKQQQEQIIRMLQTNINDGNRRELQYGRPERIFQPE